MYPGFDRFMTNDILAKEEKGGNDFPSAGVQIVPCNICFLRKTFNNYVIVMWVPIVLCIQRTLKIVLMPVLEKKAIIHLQMILSAMALMTNSSPWNRYSKTYSNLKHTADIWYESYTFSNYKSNSSNLTTLLYILASVVIKFSIATVH